MKDKECDYIPPKHTWTKEEIAEIVKAHKEWDWEIFRRETARQIMCAILSADRTFWETTDMEGFAGAVIQQTDELIRQLRTTSTKFNAYNND